MSKQWISTKGVYQWNPDTCEYDLVSEDGYWHDGPVAELKKDAKAPDYTSMADAANRYTKAMTALGLSQQQIAKEQFDRSFPIAKQVADSQINIMDQTAAQGKDYYDYQKNTFRPVEENLVSDANNYNTDAERSRQAGVAAADVEQQAAIQDEISNRRMASMGVNPNSGKFQALKRQNNLKTAAVRAGAMTNARTRAEQLGWAKRLDVAGLGRNLPGASAAAYNTSVNAGNSASGNIQSPGNAMVAGYGAGTSTIAQGAAAPMAAQGTILNNQVSQYNAANTANANMWGTAAGVGTALAISDDRLKENKVVVGKDERTGLDIYEFNFKGVPDKRYQGVMAEDVEKKFPDAVTKDKEGIKMVDYGKLGIEMKEVA